jgi:hypothetical protein
MNKDHDLNIKKAELVPTQGTNDEVEQKLIIPLDGEWYPAEDPILIGKNFRTMTNMRYDDKRPYPIQGMTKINADAITTYIKMRNAFHFRKATPAESHVLVRAFNSAKTVSVVLDNTTAIPTTGDFTATPLWTDTTSLSNGNFFCDAPNGQVVYGNGTEVCIWGGTETPIAAFLTTETALSAAGDILVNSIDATDRMINIETDSNNSITISHSAKPGTFLVGSTRKLQGINIYITLGGGNATTSTLTGKEFIGTSWSSLTLTDGTSFGGKSLAQSGKVSFSSTVASSKLKYLDGYFLYWYEFTLSAGAATIYHVTNDAPMQPLYDLWDGVFRPVAGLYKWVGTYYEDYTAAASVTSFDSPNATGPGNMYGPNQIVNMTTTTGWTFEFGFTEKTAGIYFKFPVPAVNVADWRNQSIGTTAVIKYWNGTSYVSAGTVSDGTWDSTWSTGTSMRLSGVLSWTNPNLDLEQKHSVNGSAPLYYYQLTFITADSLSLTAAYDLGGITATSLISGYGMGVNAGDRVMLGCDGSDKKNKLLISASQQADVFNGKDSYILEFGDDMPLITGASIFAQWASNIYNIVLIFKETETWTLIWDDTSTGTVWTRFCISPSIGCPSPRTVQSVSTTFEANMTQTKNLAIWRGNDGIYVSDGHAPFEVSHQIKSVFDQSASLHVNEAMVNQEVGFIDEEKMEYHWLWASGSNTTLDKEYVLDIKKWKWFEIVRSVPLQFGLGVMDTLGNKYSYGFIDTGYMERLEYGVTSDGTAISYSLETGAMLLIAQDILSQNYVTRFNLISISKNVASSLTLTVTIDEATSGANYTMSMVDASHRICNNIVDVFSGVGTFVSIKLVATNGVDSLAFEPLLAACWFLKEREKFL